MRKSNFKMFLPRCVDWRISLYIWSSMQLEGLLFSCVNTFPCVLRKAYFEQHDMFPITNLSKDKTADALILSPYQKFRNPNSIGIQLQSYSVPIEKVICFNHSVIDSTPMKNSIVFRRLSYFQANLQRCSGKG